MAGVASAEGTDPPRSREFPWRQDASEWLLSLAEDVGRFLRANPDVAELVGEAAGQFCRGFATGRYPEHNPF